jgi:hypothetical protein
LYRYIKSINKAHGSILDLFDLYDTPKAVTVGLSKLNSVDPKRLKAPGFNP